MVDNALLCMLLDVFTLSSLFSIFQSYTNRLSFLPWKRIFTFIFLKIPSPFMKPGPRPRQYPNISLAIALMGAVSETLAWYQWCWGSIIIIYKRVPLAATSPVTTPLPLTNIISTSRPRAWHTSEDPRAQPEFHRQVTNGLTLWLGTQ